jgi:prophage tail gpP-like protein
MAGNAGNARGVQDRVDLVVDGDEVILAEHYQVKAGILTQPAAFALRLGTRSQRAELFKKYPPRTPFQLQINGNVYQTGLTDGYTTSGGVGNVVLEGRDLLQAIHKDEVDNEEALDHGTFKELVQKQLDAAGCSAKDLLGLFPGSPNAGKLIFTNEANRKAITGATIRQLQKPRPVAEEKIETVAGGITKRQVQAQLGETRLSYVHRYLDLAGLFLWAAGDGSFVLSEPNPHQGPLYRLYRKKGPPAYSNIEDDRYSNLTVQRYSRCTTHARSGGRKSGRKKVFAEFVDQEMVGWGYVDGISIRDVNVDSPTRGEFLARRKIAESRRHGWKLAYKVMGHTTGAITGGKAVWAPDTMVEVDDDDLGIQGNYYIESVEFSRGGDGAFSWLELMRLEDLVFAEIST